MAIEHHGLTRHQPKRVSLLQSAARAPEADAQARLRSQSSASSCIRQLPKTTHGNNARVAGDVVASQRDFSCTSARIWIRWSDPLSNDSNMNDYRILFLIFRILATDRTLVLIWELCVVGALSYERGTAKVETIA